MEKEKVEVKNKENVEEVKNEVNEEKETVTNIFKSFDIQPKETAYGTSYVLKLVTYGDFEFEVKLTETQKILIDEVGKENCFVAVENRYSQEKRKAYLVVALHVADFETFDLFPRDRTAIALARLHYNKHIQK